MVFEVLCDGPHGSYWKSSSAYYRLTGGPGETSAVPPLLWGCDTPPPQEQTSKKENVFLPCRRWNGIPLAMISDITSVLCPTAELWRRVLDEALPKASNLIPFARALARRDPMGHELDQIMEVTTELVKGLEAALKATKERQEDIRALKKEHHKLRPFMLLAEKTGWKRDQRDQVHKLQRPFPAADGVLNWLMRILPHEGPIQGRFEVGQSLTYTGRSETGLPYGTVVEVAGPARGSSYRLRGLTIRHMRDGQEVLEDALVEDVCHKIPATEIHRQVRLGNLQALEFLKTAKPSCWANGRMEIDALDDQGEIPLAIAIREQNAKIASFLLDNGSKEGRTMKRRPEDGRIVAVRLMSGKVVGNLGEGTAKHGFLLSAQATVKDLRELVQKTLTDDKELPEGRDDIKLLMGSNSLNASWKPLNELGFDTLVCEVTMVLSGRSLLAIGSFDATVSVWNYRTGEVLHKIDNHDANSIVIYPGSQRMIMTVAEDCADAVEMDGTKTETVKHFNLGAGAITTLLLDAAGTTLGAACEDGAVTIFDASTYEQLQRLEAGDRRGFGMTVAGMSACSRWVAASGRDKTVWLWDRQDPALRPRKLLEELDKVTCISFNADASLVAIGLRDSTVRVIDIISLKESFRCSGHRGVVHGVFFSPNGDLATGSRDGTAKLWQKVDGKMECVHTFLGHSASVNAVAISPDGAYLCTGSEDSTAKIWDLNAEKRECIQTLKSHIAGISVLAFASGC